MTLNLIVTTHELLCVALAYSVFCRACRTCDMVRADVRLAFWLLGLVAFAGIAAPLVWGLVPDVFGLALLGAITVVQLVTAQHWDKGVPDKFYKTGCAPRARRSCDSKGGCHVS